MKALMILVLGSAVAAASALAQEERGHGRRHERPPFEAVQACANELGITIPERGEGTIAENSRPRISEEDHAKIHQCLEQKRAARGEGGGHEALRAKVRACLAEKGVTVPEPSQTGERPRLDEASRKILRECIESSRSEAGIKAPQDQARTAALSGGAR